jgi:hypothetical protein
MANSLLLPPASTVRSLHTSANSQRATPRRRPRVIP